MTPWTPATGRTPWRAARGVNLCFNGEVQTSCASLTDLIDAGDRDRIRAWANGRSIATINTEVAVLDETHKNLLAEVVLDTNATGTQRDKLLRAMDTTLAAPDMGFFAGIRSYTTIELSGSGFFGSCGHVWLSPGAFAGLSEHDALGVLDHESFPLV